MFQPTKPVRPRRAALLVLLSLAGALLGAAQTATAQDEYERAALKGAGSTFVAPLVTLWAQGYRHHRAGDIRFIASNTGLEDDMNGTALDYEPIGSLAGIQRLKRGAVDFALTEMPLPSSELRQHRLIQFPLAFGSVALAFNLPGVAPGALRLSGPVIADIYLGKITHWSDPAVRQLNPGLTLPDAPIKLVHRNDGSGTTFTFSSFLNGVSAEWRQRVGAESLLKWPAGMGAKGSRGMMEAVQSTPNSLGYIDAVQAREARLGIAAVQNTSGEFVLPGYAGVVAATQAAGWNPASDFYEVLVGIKGEGAYPIVASVFGLMSGKLREARHARTLTFFDWAVADGRAFAERLGYVPLPRPVLTKVRAALAERAGGA